MKENIYRSVYCGNVDKNYVGKEIRLAGWVNSIRNLGGLLFITLRDETGIVQLISEDAEKYININRESTVTITPGTTAGTATITVTSAATNNYNAATATYSATVKNGTLSVTASGYTGTYDGSAHGITVTCSGATITYATSENGTYSSTKPT